MRAFVVKIQDFFKMDTKEKDPEKNFHEDKRVLRIPLYQREYKWENEKIHTLITDIKNQQKFIGNIILDELANCYEVSDGQQRITTCYLILVFLYNYYYESPMEQKSILGLLQPYNNEFILHNDSVGNYLFINDNTIKLEISDINDVYFQKAEFERAYNTIKSALAPVIAAGEIREFKDKLLKSEVLVLISDKSTNTPIEQIFLDINEKAQLLDVEDIFKGHCFEIFSEEFYDELRNTWVELKKQAAGFNKFGFDSLSKYIYLFLLEHDNTKLPEKLNPNGQHYLEGKTMDETNALLQIMISFGKNVLQFENNIHNTDYRFCDICHDSYEYSDTRDHIALKAMSMAILNPYKPHYQKLPFMYFIYQILTNNILQSEFSHNSFRKLVTNLYIYCSLFSLRSQKKSKNIIDHTVRDALRSPENHETNLVAAAKQLRITATEDYFPNPNAKYEELSIIYSITDNYIANLNWLPEIYCREIGFNLEHFLIHQKEIKIYWRSEYGSFNIEVDRKFAKKNKQKTCNLLVTDEDLNEKLRNDDIVAKIEAIQVWYTERHLNIPKHIDTIITHIESMTEYQVLQEHKKNNAERDIIQADYIAFLHKYFSEDNESILLSALKQKFHDAFHN